MFSRACEAARAIPRAVIATIVVSATAVGLAACSSSDSSSESSAPAAPVSTDFFGYMVASRLVTTNASSAFGAASNSQVLSGRLYPAAYVPGPDGQLIPNSDLISAEEIPATAAGQRQIHYTISSHATYSDDVPVTCEDFLLAYTAGSMPSTFGSHAPLVNEIDDLQCEAGSKDFTVILKQDHGDRWKYLFGPGTVLPSHVIAQKVGMTQEELVSALQSWDPSRVADIARTWRFGFSLADFDASMQVSYGPFVIDHVGDSGEVVLKRNDSYYGDPALLDTLVVWPNSTDAAQLVAAGALRVADSTGGTPEWLDRNVDDNPYAVDEQVGELTDTLLLAEDGLFASVESRQAFAACVDQKKLAGVSSKVSGMEVPAVTEHALRHDDPIAKQLDGVTSAHLGTDIPAASALGGTTIKVGYLGPDERYAAMVESLRATCAQAGINVEDASSDFMSATYLEPDEDTGVPTIDAFLGAVDPMTEYPTVDARIGNVEALKKAEEKLWSDLPAIPIAAQPRTFVMDQAVTHVVPYTGLSGIGWNMDRWSLGDDPAAGTESPAAATTPEK